MSGRPHGIIWLKFRPFMPNAKIAKTAGLQTGNSIVNLTRPCLLRSRGRHAASFLIYALRKDGQVRTWWFNKHASGGGVFLEIKKSSLFGLNSLLITPPNPSCSRKPLAGHYT